MLLQTSSLLLVCLLSLLPSPPHLLPRSPWILSPSLQQHRYLLLLLNPFLNPFLNHFPAVALKCNSRLLRVHFPIPNCPLAVPWRPFLARDTSRRRATSGTTGRPGS